MLLPKIKILFRKILFFIRIFAQKGRLYIQVYIPEEDNEK